MKIRHYRPFFTGLFCWALAAAVIAAALFQGPSHRHPVGAVAVAALGAVEFRFAFSPKGLEAELGAKVDERALFIAAQSGHLTLRILNGLLFAGAVLALVGYGFTKDALWMAAALTLCAVVLLMFVILLAANRHYEKKY